MHNPGTTKTVLTSPADSRAEHQDARCARTNYFPPPTSSPPRRGGAPPKVDQKTGMASPT